MTSEEKKGLGLIGKDKKTDDMIELGKLISSMHHQNHWLEINNSKTWELTSFKQ